ncbi:hypothetical protein [Pseudonocardia ailaonensis]
MTGASQEHGILGIRDGRPVPTLPIGTRLRILPNHACAPPTTWSRLRGW